MATKAQKGLQAEACNPLFFLVANQELKLEPTDYAPASTLED